MSKSTHPFYQWIKANGLKMGYVAEQIGTHPRTLGRYLKTGSAPLLFQNAVKGLTDGEVFARRMGMSADRAAEFAADIARLAEQVAPLVYCRLTDKESQK